jgi:hypothetical protein
VCTRVGSTIDSRGLLASHGQQSDWTSTTRQIGLSSPWYAVAICRERTNVSAVARAVGRFRDLACGTGDPLEDLGNVQQYSPLW